MVNKKLVTLACIIFVVGLLIGIISLNVDFKNYGARGKEYPVEVNIVYAYFKVFNTSADSGIAYNQLATYILVLNVTNPSDTTLRLTDARITGYTSGGVDSFSYDRSFDESNKYDFYSGLSSLIAFSQTTNV